MEWAALTVTLLYVVSVSIFVSSDYSVLLSCNLQKPNGMCCTGMERHLIMVTMEML